MRILVVEDSPTFREFMVHVITSLSAGDLDVMQAGSLAEAAAQPTPDLVFLDLGLPDGTAETTPGQARALWPNARLVIVTATPVQLVEADGQGVSVILWKGGEESLIAPIEAQINAARQKK